MSSKVTWNCCILKRKSGNVFFTFKNCVSLMGLSQSCFSVPKSSWIRNAFVKVDRAFNTTKILQAVSTSVQKSKIHFYS